MTISYHAPYFGAYKQKMHKKAQGLHLINRRRSAIVPKPKIPKIKVSTYATHSHSDSSPEDEMATRPWVLRNLVRNTTMGASALLGSMAFGVLFRSSIEPYMTKDISRLLSKLSNPFLIIGIGLVSGCTWIGQTLGRSPLGHRLTNLSGDRPPERGALRAQKQKVNKWLQNLPDIFDNP